MKKPVTLTLLACTFCLFNSIVYGQWTKVSFNGMHEVVAQGNSIFTHNDNGYVVRSANGGTTWTQEVSVKGGTLVKGKKVWPYFSNQYLYYYNDRLLLESIGEGLYWDTINTSFLAHWEIDYDGGGHDYYYESIGDFDPVGGYYAIKKVSEYSIDAPGYTEQPMVITRNGNVLSRFSFLTDYNCHVASSNGWFEPDLYSDGKILYNVIWQNEQCQKLPIELVTSADNGFNWTHRPLAEILPPGYTFEKFLDDGQYIYLSAVSGSSRKLFRIHATASPEDGTLIPLTGDGLGQGGITALSRIDNVLYAAINTQIFKSANNGDTWTLFASGLPAVNSIDRAGNYLFAGTSNGVWRMPYAAPLNSVNFFTLVNADTEGDIRTLEHGDVIYTNQKVNIRANVSGTVESVIFYLNNTQVRRENEAPYAIGGDQNADYSLWNVAAGTYELKAIAFSGANGSGTASQPNIIRIKVVSPQDTVSGMRFMLVDAALDRDLYLINNNEVITKSNQDKISIRAIPSKPAKSVVFRLNGTITATESTAPYALRGDKNGDYTPWNASSGMYTLVATSYSEVGGRGTVVETKTITFRVNVSSAAALNTNISSYPNPVKDRMRISVQNETIVDSKIQIFDFNGKLYYSGNHSFTQNESEIDLTGIDMSPGFYVVKMETESGVKVLRIVKD